jgi:hypothetical protein
MRRHVADVHSIFLSNLTSPFGMVLVGDQLYIANTDALVRVPYSPGALKITARPVKVTDLPGGPLNHHWTKNVVASPDGSKLYVAVGSNSNVAENGIGQEKERAAIWEVDARTGAHRESDCARLRARTSHCISRPDQRARQHTARAIRSRHVRGPARLVEPRTAKRLQRDLRAVRQWQTIWPRGRCAHRLRARQR